MSAWPSAPRKSGWPPKPPSAPPAKRKSALRREAEEAKAAAEAKKREDADKLVRLLAEQKAARDAQYAARKDRQKKGRR